MKHNIFDLFLFFSPFLFLSVSFGIGATIRTRLEIQCLPYAGFFMNIQKKWIVIQGRLILEELNLSVPLPERATVHLILPRGYISHAQLLNIIILKFNSPVLLNLLGNIFPYCPAVGAIWRIKFSNIDLQEGHCYSCN